MVLENVSWVNFKNHIMQIDGMNNRECYQRDESMVVLTEMGDMLFACKHVKPNSIFWNVDNDILIVWYKWICQYMIDNINTLTKTEFMELGYICDQIAECVGDRVYG